MLKTAGNVLDVSANIDYGGHRKKIGGDNKRMFDTQPIHVPAEVRAEVNSATEDRGLVDSYIHNEDPSANDGYIMSADGQGDPAGRRAAGAGQRKSGMDLHVRRRTIDHGGSALPNNTFMKLFN